MALTKRNHMIRILKMFEKGGNCPAEKNYDWKNGPRKNGHDPEPITHISCKHCETLMKCRPQKKPTSCPCNYWGCKFDMKNLQNLLLIINERCKEYNLPPLNIENEIKKKLLAGYWRY